MQMVGLPDDHPTWIDLVDPEYLQEVSLQLGGDPYFLAVLSEEDNPSEDKEADDLEEVEEYKDEGILQNAIEEMDVDDPIKDEDECSFSVSLGHSYLLFLTYQYSEEETDFSP